MSLKASKIKKDGNSLFVPDMPIIPFIQGDGIGKDVMQATILVVDQAVKKSYQDSKKIAWLEVLAGEKSFLQTGEYLPQKTLDALAEHFVSLKGPLTTPVGEGIRSLNVEIRQKLNLYACIRPVRYFKGIVSPLKNPEKTDFVIFRENTEDLYAGIEWQSNTEQALKIIDFLKFEMNVSLDLKAGIGIKPITPFATKNIMRKAIKYAIEHKKPNVTIVHKGNIMKYTEGAFKNWAYDLAVTEFREAIITQDELTKDFNNIMPANKILIKDCIADNMFQQVLINPERFSVVVSPNLNGDYLSDACAAQVGGLGMAPGANIGDSVAVFEATHGSAPKYANQNKANPGSLLLSAVMMLEYLAWFEASQLIVNALQKTILDKTVTYDLARGMENSIELGTKEFALKIIENM